MKLEYKVTVEVDQEGYNMLLAKGYSDFQIKHNVATNMRAMFGFLQKHWYRVIYDIDVEEVEKNDEVIILCQNGT